MAQLADNNALLIYRVGPVLCCAPTLPIETLIPPPSLTRPPGSSDAHPGIFRHDGKLVRLTDMRQLFGVAEQDRSQPGRIAICRLDTGYSGFLVDEIIDVILSPASGWGQISPSLSGGVFTRSLLLNDKIHLYAEFAQLHKVRHAGFLKPWIEHLQQEARKQDARQIEATTQQREAVNATRPVVAATPAETGNSRTSLAGAASTAAPAQPESPHPASDKAEKKPAAVHPIPETPVALHADKTANTSSFARHPETRSGETPSPPPTRQPEDLQSQTPTATKIRTTNGGSPPSSLIAGRPSSRSATAGSSTRPPNPGGRSRAATVSASPAGAPDKQRNIHSSVINPSAHTHRPAPAKSDAPQPRISTVNRAASSSATDENRGFSGGLVFALIVFIGGISGAFVYLWPNADPDPGGKIQPVSITPPPRLTDNDDRRESLPPTPAPAPAPIPETGSAELISPSPETSDNQTRYHARIARRNSEQGGREVTITIIAPTDDEAVLLQPEAPLTQTPARNGDAGPPIPAETDSAGADKAARNTRTGRKTDPGDEAAKNAQTDDSPRVQAIDEIVHRVVPGDTLWHIAQRYIHDPFRYPELARLNNIRNPDLIYPGDRVRIIRVRHSPSTGKQITKQQN